MYQWWVFVHLAGVFGFLTAHGVSVMVLFRLRKERDPAKVNALIQFSGSTIRVFYISLAVLLLGGVVAGFLGHWWSYGWIWGAIGILVLTTLAMYSMARPYYRRVDRIARAMAGGSQAVTEEQFDEILRSGRPTSIAIIGVVGLGLILYLMVLKPTLGFTAGGGSVTPVASCAPGGTALAVVAKGIAFDTSCLAAPAGQAFTIRFDNQDGGGVPHNVSIYTNASATTALFKGDEVDGPKTVTYSVSALAAGTYYFRCDFHPPQMNGTFIVS